MLFQVVAARYEVGSIVITTNRPFREWGKILDVDNTLATALIDRLMHHGEGIVIRVRPLNPFLRPIIVDPNRWTTQATCIC